MRLPLGHTHKRYVHGCQECEHQDLMRHVTKLRARVHKMDHRAAAAEGEKLMQEENPRLHKLGVNLAIAALAWKMNLRNLRGRDRRKG